MAKKKKNEISFEYGLGTLLIIKWTDICSYDGWLEKEESEKARLIDAVSVGWFLNTDETAIRITGTIADNTNNVLVIPKAVVKEIQVVEIGD